jgi:hypothetical protein
MQTALQAEKQATTTKFRKGQSGNPRGRLDGRRYRETFAALASELGGEATLSPSQRLLIDTIAKLQSRRGHQDSVRVANALARLVPLLGIKAKPVPTTAGESLKDVLQELATDAADARSDGGGG